MNQKSDVLAIIYKALEALNSELPPEKHVTLAPETSLFGQNSALDSLALVSVIVDVEEMVGDTYGQAISLADDRAISQPVSPFATVETLADYVCMLLNEPS